VSEPLAEEKWVSIVSEAESIIVDAFETAKRTLQYTREALELHDDALRSKNTQLEADVERMTKERDDGIAMLNTLGAELATEREAARLCEGLVEVLTKERDEAREKGRAEAMKAVRTVLGGNFTQGPFTRQLDGLLLMAEDQMRKDGGA
jgi:peptidoglycan hydrolase CwlO-like protein